MIDPGIGHHPAALVLGDDQVLAMAHDAFRLGQHQLDKARIFAGFFRQLFRRRRGRDSRDVDKPALGFRDNLLRNDQHVAGFKADIRIDQRGNRDRMQIVAGLHHRHSGQCDDRNPIGHFTIRLSFRDRPMAQAWDP